MPLAVANGRIEAKDVKAAARGREIDVLVDVGGIPRELLDGLHHPCPKCGGKDRFRLVDAQAGAVRCNQCFPTECGDFIAAIQWMTGQAFPVALRSAADYVDVRANGTGHTSPDVMTAFCRQKHVTVESLRSYGATVARRGVEDVVRVPMVNEKAEVVGHQDYGLSGALAKGLTVKGEKAGLFVPGRLPKAGETVIAVEGVKDAAGLHKVGFFAVGTPGTMFRPAWAHAFRGCDVVLVPDRDTPSYHHFERVANLLAGIATSVARIDLPFEMRETGGQDVRDLLSQQNGERTLRMLIDDAVEAAKAKVTATASGVPQIIVGVDESRVIDEAIAALGPKVDIFQRAGDLVQVVQDAPPPRGIARPKDAPRITQLKLARLRELLAASAEWVRPESNDKLVCCHPPEWAFKGVEARGQWPDVRPIEGIVESPVIRSDGSVLQVSGYDAATGLLFRPRGAFPRIPDAPTIDDARKAVLRLLEVVADFPFADAVHRAAWLSGILTPLARFAFYGPAPLHLIDANVRGSGKSLLADTIGEITFGRAMARMAAPNDDDEFRKRITALALAAEPLVLIDNVATALGGPAIDAALTATAWSDRMLGQSKMVTGLPLTMTWFATGNNVILLADTARRTLHIRLESPDENPEERSGFRHPNLLTWIRRNRALLVTSAVTVLAAYFAAGCPDMSLKPWGSFEAWSDLVRQAIVWAGQMDPGETRQELAGTADIEANALRRLIEGWAELDPDGYGMTVAKVLDAIEDFQRQAGTMPSEYQTIRDAIVELVPTKGGRLPSARSVGMKLNRFRQRVVEGRYLDSRPARDGNYWVVQTVQKEGNVRD